MEKQSIKSTLILTDTHKKIVVYEYGNSPKKVLLVHGWSGRGTQLFKVADTLIKKGYMIVSFDAPAHGKSEGSLAIVTDFINSVLSVQKQYGPFETVIGHSLGGLTVLNSLTQGLKVKNAIIIGSGDKVEDVLSNFISKLKLKQNYAVWLKEYFENKYQVQLDDYSSYKAASKISIPVLVIHDRHDPEVPVLSSEHIVSHLKQGKLVLTKGLGHRNILGNPKVLESIGDFLAEQDKINGLILED